MSDRMQPIPFEALLDWVFGEYQAQGSIFGVKKFWRPPEGGGEPFMGRSIESAVGPAAGPHTQLAQNIVTAYLCGGRVFELKTVQVIDGEDLHVSKPCILAEDEGYNCEWSTELTVPQARDEYIKAWVLLHVLAKELGLGRADGFAFCMSVGYNLAGIQSPKIDGFLDDMRDAARTDVFLHCLDVLKRRLGDFSRFTSEDLAGISPSPCNNVTVSTMHGCPSEEIEKIAEHLLENKKLNLYIKCNPTLVGYHYARRSLDALGFDYIQFEHEAFDRDLRYREAVSMLRRIRDRAEALGLFFGVKLTNTLAVKARQGELPDENMYMSGRTLLPLSLHVAARLSRDFDRTLPISYCGGANAKNIALLYRAGLFPITVCSELLKPGGYEKLYDMAAALEGGGASGIRTKHTVLDRLSKSLCARARDRHAPRRAPRPQQPEVHANCRTVCGSCASVCPNRANVIIQADGRKQMLHIDGMCNECGNCASYCAERGAPYLEKLTVFCSAEELKDSLNAGFARLPDGKYLLRWDGGVREIRPEDPGVPVEISTVIAAVRDHYPWLLYR